MHRLYSKVALFTVGLMMLASCSEPIPLYPLYQNQNWESEIGLTATFGGSGHLAKPNHSDAIGNAYLPSKYTFKQANPATDADSARDQFIAYFDKKSNLPITWTISSPSIVKGQYSDDLVSGHIGVFITQLENGTVQILTECEQAPK
jgi:hypothetical protein